MKSPSYKLPVEIAKKVQKETGLEQIIILGWEKETGFTHFSSYGKTKKDCGQAAKGIDNLDKIFKHGMSRVLELIEEDQKHVVTATEMLERNKRLDKEWNEKFDNIIRKNLKSE